MLQIVAVPGISLSVPQRHSLLSLTTLVLSSKVTAIQICSEDDRSLLLLTLED
jgi:hypothetical protein